MNKLAPFSQSIVNVLKRIPAGRVATYGQVAAVAGNPNGARQVVRILHACSDSYGLPWHRVVNGKGEIAINNPEGAYEQRVLLELEGVRVDPYGRIDLRLFLWNPAGKNKRNDISK